MVSVLRFDLPKGFAGAMLLRPTRASNWEVDAPESQAQFFDILPVIKTRI
jgi:hypothetical protein